jgi:hypothetical protein
MNKLNKEFILQYLNTALWSSCDIDSDEPLDRAFSVTDIDLSTIKKAVKDCLNFIEIAEKNDYFPSVDYSQYGHDFWLTRNGHGTGFWDRDDGLQGEKLSDLSRSYNELYPMPYIFDHGERILKIEF